MTGVKTAMPYQDLIDEARRATVAFATSADCQAGLAGAALITVEGLVYSGCSIDCACGIGFCAEHAAIAEMLKHRATRIKAIVASNKRGRIVPPCGRCRELMYQVDPANLDTDVVIAADKIVKLRDLLPFPWQHHRISKAP
jgi:cytidine deaminase